MIIAIEQWRFFSVLLWHGATVYDDHLRGPLTLTPIVERLAVDFYDLGLSRLGFQQPNFRLRGERSNQLRHRRNPRDRLAYDSL